MLAFVAFVLGCLLAGGCGFALARRSSRGGVAVLVVLLLVVCAKAVLAALPHWEWWLLPWPGYVYVQQLLLWPVAAVFLAVAAARLPVRWNRVVVLLAGVGVVALGARENRWLAWPALHGEAVYAGADHHLRQSTAYTCGPAACVAAASRCGVRISERDMARLCLTHSGGSRLFNLYRGLVLALDGRPYDVSIRALCADELRREGRVTIVANGGGGHALCVVGRGDSALVHDPLYAAPAVWTAAELRQRYTPPAVVVTPRGAAAAAPR